MSADKLESLSPFRPASLLKI